MEKLITIITSVYNYPQEKFDLFFEDTIRQTIFNLCQWEIFEVGGNNLDVPNLPNVRYTSVEKRLTVYEVWNLIIKGSRTPYFANYNCDDRSHPQHLEILLAYLLRNPSVRMAYCPNIETNVDGETFETTKSVQGFPCLPFDKNTYHRCNSGHARPVWARSLHETVGFFDERYVSAADFDFWLRCIRAGVEFAKVGDEPLYLYYRNPEGISSSAEGVPIAMKEIGEIMRNHMSLMDYPLTQK